MAFNLRPLLLISALLPSIAFAEPLLKPFSATYESSYSGISITAVRELKNIGNDKVKISFDADSWAADIRESSIFTIKNNQLEPLEYKYKRTGVGKNKDLKVKFDYDTNTIISENNGKTQSTEKKETTFDPLTYQLQMQADLAEQKTSLEYHIADGKRFKHYEFKVIGKEQLKTAIGTLQTTRVERVKAGSSDKTIIWFADNWDFLIVKIERIEDGSTYSVDLVKANVDGQTVTPKTTVTLGKNL